MVLLHILSSLVWIALTVVLALRAGKLEQLLPKGVPVGAWIVAATTLVTGLALVSGKYSSAAELFTNLHGAMLFFKGLLVSVSISTQTVGLAYLRPQLIKAEAEGDKPLANAFRGLMLPVLGGQAGMLVLAFTVAWI